MIRTLFETRRAFLVVSLAGGALFAASCGVDSSGIPGGGASGGVSGAAGSSGSGGGAVPPGGSGTGGAGVNPSGGSGGTVVGGAGGAPAVDGGSTPTGAITLIATMGNRLNHPTDLKFNPYADDELWITNWADNSMIIISGVTGEDRMGQRRQDPSNSHFMDHPAGIAFGDRATTIIDADGKPVIGTFATCGESRNGGDDFMGPVMWTPDLRIFGLRKQDRIPPFNGPMAGSLGSHIDMLHLSPLCTGIAWEGAGNIYWTYAGTSKAFVRYDFRKDHWIGNDDHSDGAEWRYVFPGQLGYVAGVPSHMSYVVEEKALYFADTANGRVVKFNPAASATSKTMRTPDPLKMGPVQELSGGMLIDVVPKGGALEKPSGLEVRGGFLYVSDNARSTVNKFTLAGALLKSVKIDSVAAGGLAGLTVGPDGKVYVVDMVGNKALRLEDKL